MPLVRAAELSGGEEVEKMPLVAPVAGAADAEEDCGDWGPPADADEASGWNESEHDIKTGNVAPLSCFQHLQLLGICIVSLPAIIGSWCWPSLIGLLSGAASSSAFNNGSADKVKSFFHGLQVAIMMTIMTNMTHWIYNRTKVTRKSQPTHWLKWRPVYLLMLSTVMVLFQPMSILVIGSWQIGMCQKCGDLAGCDDGAGGLIPLGGLLFPPGCYKHVTNLYWTDDVTQTAFPNRAGGWLIQVFLTYGGFIVMFVGINDATGLVKKFKKRFQATRQRMLEENAAKGVAA